MSGLLRRLRAAAPNFQDDLEALLHWELAEDGAVRGRVREIIAEVRATGDAALLAYTAQFDGVEAKSVGELEVPQEALREAFETLPEAERSALKLARDRIAAYHERQRRDEWRYKDEFGNLLGQLIRPLDRVGLYVPGGQAAYPSSVLMTAVPAKVAGVREVIMTVPTPGGVLNPLVLAAAHLAGVHRVYRVGGAQAIAALAYGTESLSPVDKIVGPGGAYVAEAKRQVFGPVGIDMIAGPSEILVLADGAQDPHWLAMDLFSQAEHDEAAQAILVSPDPALLDAVEAAGGVTSSRASSTVNLARLVVDGEQIDVGADPRASGGTSRISLNSADAQQLQQLPGVGPVIAERIVAWRTANGPFRSVAELGEVSGVGPAMIARIEDQVGM